MKHSPALWLLAAVLMVIPATAQIPQPGIRSPGLGRPASFSSPNGGGAAEPALGANYRITFAGKAAEKPKGEVSTLTCSPLFQVSGPLEQGEMPTSMTLSGTLAEQEGGTLLFGYSIGLSVPVVSSTMASGPNAVVSVASNIQYVQHQATGTLKMVPGKSYDLLKVGGVSYTLTIAPEPEK